MRLGQLIYEGHTPEEAEAILREEHLYQHLNATASAAVTGIGNTAASHLGGNLQRLYNEYVQTYIQTGSVDTDSLDWYNTQKDIDIGKSVGAKARNYEILLPNGEIVYLTEGTRVSSVEVIAGKGRNRDIDMIYELMSWYPDSDPYEWKKVAGIGYIDYEGESWKVELHWYEEPSTGRVEWKVKPDEDGNWFIYED